MSETIRLVTEFPGSVRLFHRTGPWALPGRFLCFPPCTPHWPVAVNRRLYEVENVAHERFVTQEHDENADSLPAIRLELCQKL